MRLVTYLQGSKKKVGVLLGDWLVGLQAAHDYLVTNRLFPEDGPVPDGSFPDSMVAYLADNSPLKELARSTAAAIQARMPAVVEPLLSAGVLRPFGQAVLLPPVPNPGKLICVGMNYPSASFGEQPKPGYPTLFLKSASTLTGHRQPIQLPQVSAEVFCEGELAVVIGKQGKHIPVEAAHTYIAGYTIANDVGARDLEQRTSQWATGKLPDTFCPMGPAVVTPDEIRDPASLTIRTSVNGTCILSGNTHEMFFGVADLISYISSLATLVPGDIILTGSPKKVADQPAPVVYLQPGDQVSIEIEEIGVLSNHTISEELTDA